ncbi:O-acetyltransferase PaAT-1 [Pseudocercospora fuligena]|uniref:O-acetyltransferase PaAT-1 n=1 Tax=Pseudocercospora fuligena TaxID=685502 RepID=A0A8H6RFV5_9PEZI|nr:O-acetyltransferase PaAT-1 [Pseudocercospora fuligena]
MGHDTEKRHFYESKERRSIESPRRLDTIVSTASSDDSSSARYEHLDGLRGLAAVCVVIMHVTPDFTEGLHEHGFGEVMKYWHLTSFPFIRLMWSGGNAAVPIFFVLSGFALSIAPLRLLREKGRTAGPELRRKLMAAVLRRPIRLYAPAIAITILQAVFRQIPGLCILNPNIPPVPKANLVQELGSAAKVFQFFWPFQDHEAASFPYNQVMWTLPIEMNGSLLVYAMLLLFSLGAIAGPGVRAPATFSALLLIGGAIVLQTTRHWSFACFAWGVMLAVIDQWPVGTHFQYSTNHLYRRLRIMRGPQTLPVVSEKTTKPRTDSLLEVLAKLDAFAPHLCLFLGWYLLSIPGYPDHRYCADTLGWQWLNGLIPRPFDNDFRFHRYWTTVGSLPVVYAVLRIGWLQTFFKTKALVFLGRVSFALYLVHLPMKPIIEERIKPLVGGYTNPPLEGTFWDHYWNVSDVGPPGLSPRYLIAMAVIMPCFLLVAWAATVAIDEPFVRMSKNLTRKLGLDKPRRMSATAISEV